MVLSVNESIKITHLHLWSYDHMALYKFDYCCYYTHFWLHSCRSVNCCTNV